LGFHTRHTNTIWADAPDHPIAGLAPIAANVNIVMQAAPAEFVRRRKQQNRSTLPLPSNPSSIPNNVMPPLRKALDAGAWHGRMDFAGSMGGKSSYQNKRNNLIINKKEN